MAVRLYLVERVVTVVLDRMVYDVILVVTAVAAIRVSVLVAPCTKVCSPSVADSWLWLVWVLVVAEVGLACTSLLLVCIFR